MPQSKLVRELLSLGWKYNDGLIQHPRLPEINLWESQYTGEMLFSPGLVEFVKEHQGWFLPVVFWISESAPKKSAN